MSDMHLRGVIAREVADYTDEAIDELARDPGIVGEIARAERDVRESDN